VTNYFTVSLLIFFSVVTCSVSPSKKDVLPASMFRKSPSKAGPSHAFGAANGSLGAKASLNAEDSGMQPPVLDCIAVLIIWQ